MPDSEPNLACVIPPPMARRFSERVRRALRDHAPAALDAPVEVRVVDEEEREIARSRGMLRECSQRGFTVHGLSLRECAKAGHRVAFRVLSGELTGLQAWCAVADVRGFDDDALILRTLAVRVA